jgi:hypothetical protein
VSDPRVQLPISEYEPGAIPPEQSRRLWRWALFGRIGNGFGRVRNGGPVVENAAAVARRLAYEEHSSGVSFKRAIHSGPKARAHHRHVVRQDRQLFPAPHV